MSNKTFLYCDLEKADSAAKSLTSYLSMWLDSESDKETVARIYTGIQLHKTIADGINSQIDSFKQQAQKEKSTIQEINEAAEWLNKKTTSIDKPEIQASLMEWASSVDICHHSLELILQDIFESKGLAKQASIISLAIEHLKTIQDSINKFESEIF